MWSAKLERSIAEASIFTRNQAGSKVDFAGCIGTDGEWLRKELVDYGVGVSEDILLLDDSVSLNRLHSSKNQHTVN